MALRLLGRLLSLAILVAAAATLWPALQRQRALQETALAELDREQAEVAALLDADPAPPAAAPEPERGERTYYRYVDAGGTLHFVDALERVPEDLRGSAKAIAMAGAPAAAPPTPRRAAAPGPRPPRPFERIASLPAAAHRDAAHGVVVYTAPWCGWCRKTLAWLDERGVAYENRDIERSGAFREELIEKTGSASIPVVEIEGELVRGYDPGRLAELL